jgi:murein DD-endopeptidase MepM/ murein hydrolase activator NlpD
MKYRLHASVLVFCIFQLAQFALAGTNGVAPFQLKISGKRLFPGDVFQVNIQGRKPIQEVEASFAGQRILFYSGSAGKAWNALVGIDLETKAGCHSIKGNLRLKDGRSEIFERSLQILPKDFPTQRITVDEKFVTLSPEDSKRAAEEGKKTESIWAKASSEKFWQGRFLVPVESELTSGFGRRRVVNNQPRSPHSGVDLKAATGTPIQAANSGKVVLAEELFFTGNTVIIDHGLGLYTYYAHCSKLQVQVGEEVEKGQVIGEVGSTGRVTGPHLHWACRLNGARVNPLNLTTGALGGQGSLGGD